AQDHYQFTDPQVADLIRYARMSVGGDVAKLRAVEMKGRSKVDAAGTLLPCTVDIKILFPDHYLRVDTAASREAKLAGRAGKKVLNAVRTDANLSLPPENLHPAILKNEQWRLARLLLGAAMYVSPTVPMIFRSSGMTGFPIDPRVSPKTSASLEGPIQPNAAEITGPNGFAAHLEFEASTRMPVRIMYGNAREEKITFDDRRDINGLKLPFRVVTSVGDRIVDELAFDQIILNPEISKSEFTNKR